jgi:hypothetical protein
MELIILLIKLLIRGLDPESRSGSRNLPNFSPPAAPPPLPVPPYAPATPAQMGNRPPTAQPAKPKSPLRRPPVKAGQQPAAATKSLPTETFGRGAVQPSAVKASAAPAQLIAEALRSPRNFAAAVLMTELLGPPASLLDRRTNLD